MQAWAEKPMDCGNITSIDGVAKLVIFECEGDRCGARVIAPSTYDSKPFLGFTLIVGEPPEADFSAYLKYAEHDSIVDVSVYGNPEEMVKHKIWAVYGGKGMCPKHSVVKLEKQHNKTSNATP